MTTNKRFSFEFFPPQTDAGREKLRTVRAELSALNPAFFSLTYGAGGSTRGTTQGIALEMKQEGLDIAPHLSFGGDTEEAILALINTYKAAGINRLVALRGDIPSGLGASRSVYANELVAFIRKHTGDHFTIEVAAYPEVHPESESFDSELHYFKQKIDAGADSAITQYFFNADSYFYFVDVCAKMGINKPIYPGIMPITNYKNIARFSANCGAEIPRWMAKRFESLNDQDSERKLGEELATQLCERLLEGGAPGIHFYSMNQIEPNKTIWNNLGL
jgi:methylenetetrahydrofolate reductase (NADPH)